MALGDSDYSRTAGEIITKAYRAIRVLTRTETASASQMVDGIEALNMLLKNAPWANFTIWQNSRATLSLSAKIEFTFVAGGDLTIDTPHSIVSALLRNASSGDTILTPMTLDEFEAIPDKTAIGSPLQYYYEVQLDGGHFYLDIIPNATVAAFTVPIVYKDRIDSIVLSTDAVDVTPEWYDVLYSHLAVRLAPDNDGVISDALAAVVTSSLANAKSFQRPRQLTKNKFSI